MRHRAREKTTSSTQSESDTGTEGGTARPSPRARRVARLLVTVGVLCALASGCAFARLAVAGALPDLSLSDGEWADQSLLKDPSFDEPGCRVVELGYSVSGIPLEMTVVGNGAEKVLIVGGAHGDEPTGAMLAIDLERYLAENQDLIAGYTVGILAEVNPDGLLAGTRVNANGVDLNRNYPSQDWRKAKADELSHGPHSASEPETVAVMLAVELLQPARIVDIHSIKRGWHCNNYDGPAETLAKRAGDHNGYPVRASIGYPTPGALGNWAGINRGIPTITLELPRDLGRAQCWRENKAALLAVIGVEPALIGR